MSPAPSITVQFTVPPHLRGDLRHMRAMATTMGANLAMDIGFAATQGAEERLAAAQFESLLCHQMVDLDILRTMIQGVIPSALALPPLEWLRVDVHDIQAPAHAPTCGTRVCVRTFPYPAGHTEYPEGTLQGWLQLSRIPRTPH